MPPSRRLSPLPAALAQLPDAPRLYLRLEVFVKQELVPASKPDASLASRILNEIESIGTAVTQAQIARQNAQSNTIPPSGPGSQPSLGYDILDARYDSLKYERRYLSIVYYQIARLGYFSPNEVQKSIDWLAANPNDTTTSYILAATLAAFDSAEPHSFPGKVRKNLATDKGTIAYMKRQLASNTYWKEPGLKATILLKWTLFMAETRHCDPTLENQQGFKTEELESQIWDAVQADAFTYLAAALIQFHKCTHTSPVSSFVQFVQFVPEQQQKEPLAEEFQLPVLNMCDVLVRSLLTYASSELRKIKQRQEDLLASVWTDRSRMFRSIAPPSSEIEGQPAPRNDITMLYSLIGVLYVSLPPERALQFWGATPTGETRGLSYMELTETSAGKLPSFLQWAVWSTQVRDVDMTMALYDMLSGLAKGKKCSELAYNFLARGGGEVIPGSSLPSSTGSYNAGPSISWSTIFALLESWTSPAPSPRTNQPPSLAASFGGFGSLAISQPHPPTQQPPQHIPIGPKDVLLAQSFLRLLSTVATSSVAVRLAISSNTQFRAIPTLVSLVPLGIPLELKGAIFDALAAFCEPGAGVAGVDICKSVWTLMERVEVINVRPPVSGRAVGAGAVLPPVKGVEVELDEVEAVYKLYPATIPFLNLLATLLHTPKRLSPRSLLADAEPLNTIPESLGQPYRLPGIGPYVSFMVDNVFAGLPRREYARHSERWRMNDLCLKFVERALAGWEIENLVRASEDGLLRRETVIPLLIHPGFEVLTRLLTNSPLQSTILSYIVDGIKGFEHELPSEEPYFLLTIIRVLRIIHRVLKIHDVFLDVLVAILSEFDSAPFVGTVHSMSFYTRFDQALTYGPTYPELVLTVRIISQLSCSTSVTSLLILIERSPDSERILSSFRQLLDIDSLDDVDMAETTQSIVPVRLVLQTEKPKSHWIKLSGSRSSTSSSVTRNVKQRTPISAISSCSAVQCWRTADENQLARMQNDSARWRCMQNHFSMSSQR
ncbi:nucleoporin Nup186/Nup192/Nup205 [Boletus edulis BED1]|uniref:Nucleoporin Nup186/Nup192/Nup205 n=1 Tax=Boletus edulis BED1 TaxID=1328754 RepID=A0AAD4G7Q6_BOLED|nr:nucleoporin Nup186/Nup192/Nup205 [Boletus edulis BED1]